MNYSLCLQATYHHVDIALCNGERVISSLQIPSRTASALLIPSLDRLLKDHNLLLKDCLYIAAHQGPAPFTTLRTILATINGIQCATTLALIGIDGLKSLVSLHKSNDTVYTIALLNAFNNELYYAIQSHETIITGYAALEALPLLLQNIIKTDSALFIGNGVHLFKNSFPDFFNNNALLTNILIEECTITDIAYLAWQAWHRKEAYNVPLMPLYLKKHAVERT